MSIIDQFSIRINLCSVYLRLTSYKYYITYRLLLVRPFQLYFMIRIRLWTVYFTFLAYYCVTTITRRTVVLIVPISTYIGTR